MARRPIFGTPARGATASAATGNTNFDLLGLQGADRNEYAYIGGINSLDKALADLRSQAAERTNIEGEVLTDVIAKGLRIGATWQLMNVRAARADSLWTVNVGEAHIIKREHLQVIEVPAGTKAGELPVTVRGGGRVRMHQADLAVWNNAGTNGTLLFLHLRANQRAMLVSFSVQHLGTCARVFINRPIIEDAVEWVQENIANGTLEGNLRRAEGLEYVSSCIRIYKAYTTARDATDGTEDKGIEAAQKSLAPRGGTQQGASPTQSMQRMMSLAAHLLSTVARAGLETPFGKMLPNMLKLGVFARADYNADEVAIWNEIVRVGQSETERSKSFAELVYPQAANLYASGFNDAGVKQPVPADTTAVNTVTGGRESFVWYSAVPEKVEEGELREYVTDWSDNRYQSAPIAIRTARRQARFANLPTTTDPTFSASTVDFLRAMQGPSHIEGAAESDTRFRWEHVQRLRTAPPISMQTYDTRAEAEAALVLRPDFRVVEERRGEGLAPVYILYPRRAAAGE